MARTILNSKHRMGLISLRVVAKKWVALASTVMEIERSLAQPQAASKVALPIRAATFHISCLRRIRLVRDA